MSRTYLEYRTAFAHIAKPFAYLDLDLLEENMKQIIQRAQGKRIRIASKSLRSVALIKRILSAADCFSGVMCFTIPEALYLSQQGLDDLLVAYPAWERSHLEQVLKLNSEGKVLTVMVDSSVHLKHLEDIARAHGGQFRVCIDVDMSLSLPALHFGVRRSPVRTSSEVELLVKKIMASPHLHLDGIMGYEAQIAGVGDHYPGQWVKNKMIHWLKQRSIRDVAKKRRIMVEAIEKLGCQPRFVNGGGTGSLASTCQEEVVTEVTVGSGFYSPVLFDYYREFRYQPAAGFALEIVRVPDVNHFTCLGGGYIASGSTGTDKTPKPYLPDGLRLLAMEGAGEVQTPVYSPRWMDLQLGDPIFFRHSKAGELCERFRYLYLYQGGQVVERVTTYRGDEQCFL
ncbi:amino acid deaminase/aldolase [Mechercharimyces sp. CAU 1602]|nr:amino acid deaminase/aldolase [Mechercharimyces sp. CAU 1602]MCS1350825.1 amino acid deaminase/aldolase [Mechercharimyces sp. CAU 1602]